MTTLLLLVVAIVVIVLAVRPETPTTQGQDREIRGLHRHRHRLLVHHEVIAASVTLKQAWAVADELETVRLIEPFCTLEIFHRVFSSGPRPQKESTRMI